MSVFVIAEAGVNHNGSADVACELVDVAAASGADCIKFQTFRANDIASAYAPKAEYQKSSESAQSQLEMLRALELDNDAHRRIVARCHERSIHFMSSPFDLGSLAFLVDELAVDRIKLGSGEITNGPLLWQAARSGKPIILSTGMSVLADIENALGVVAHGYLHPSEKPSRRAFHDAYISEEGAKILGQRVTLLHCTTEYPAPFHDVNLGVLATLRAAFGTEVGFSDHTPGITVPIAAVALGATVIEKHFTLDRKMRGPDHTSSLEPQELKAMVDAIRQTEAAIGQSRKVPAPSEIANAGIARKSLVAARAIDEGEIFSSTNLVAKRPGGGISPIFYWDYLGRRALRAYSADELIDA